MNSAYEQFIENLEGIPNFSAIVNNYTPVHRGISLLYIGMADDIISPLLLVPDVDIIYSITYDPNTYHHNSETDYRSAILQYLLTGQGGHYGQIPPSQIIEAIQYEDRWEVDFFFLNKPRKLVYYTGNAWKTWPSRIRNINVFMDLGAFILGTNESKLKKTFKKMLETRMTSPFLIITDCPESDLGGVELEDFEHPYKGEDNQLGYTLCDKKCVKNIASMLFINKFFTYTGIPLEYRS